MIKLLIVCCLLMTWNSCKDHHRQERAHPATSVTRDSILPGVKSHAKYEQYIFDPETGTTNFSYNYSGIWDFDGDKKTDSICFIGNGGAHTYFYLRIILSSDRILREFNTVNIDFPLIADKELLDKYGKNALPQFVVHDFNNDGNPDIYLNFYDPYGDPNPIPKEWKRQGVWTEYVVLSFAGNKLTVKDYFTSSHRQEL